jgi:hypothetical protein
MSGIKHNEPLFDFEPLPKLYGQRIIGNEAGRPGCPSGFDVHVQNMRKESVRIFPDTRPVMRNLNEEYERKRDLLEQIMIKELEIQDMKRELAK